MCFFFVFFFKDKKTKITFNDFTSNSLKGKVSPGSKRLVRWLDPATAAAFSPLQSTVSIASHCFTACSLKDWNSLLHGAKKKKNQTRLFGARRGGKGPAWRESPRSKATYLAAGAVSRAVNRDGYGLLDCNVFLNRQIYRPVISPTYKGVLLWPFFALGEIARDTRL